MADEKEKSRTLKKIFAGGSVMFFAVIVSKVLALTYRLITGRFLGPEDYGVITLMMTVYSTVTTFAYLSIQEGVQKYVSEYRGTGNHSRIKGTIYSGLSMILLISSIVGIGLFLASKFIAINIFDEKAAVWPIRFVGLSLPFLGVMKTLTNVAEGYEKMKPTAYTGQISVNVIKVALTAALVYLGFGYLGAAFAFSFSIVCGAAIAYYFYRNIIPEEVLESEAEFNHRELAYFSAPLVAGGVFGVISRQIDTYMVQYFLGTSKVGLYNAAYPFAMLVYSFSAVFSSVFMSAASRLRSQGDKEINAEIFRSVTKWISGLSVPVFLILFFFPETALIFFGKGYYGAAEALKILSVGFLLSAITGPVTDIYQAHDSTHLNFLTSAILAISNLVLNYMFIAVLGYGIEGAAIATTLSFGITAVFNVYMSYRFTGRFPFKLSTFKIWVAGVIAITVPFVISNQLFKVTPRWFFPIDLALFGGLYAFMIGFGGILTQEDRIIIEAILRKVGLDDKYAELLRYS
ncbi:MAG: flippase [Candidatus Nanohalobium sp.]